MMSRKTASGISFIVCRRRLGVGLVSCSYVCARVCANSPAQHQLGVLALHIPLHHLQQQGPHDVGVVLQLAVEGHREQGGKGHLGPGVEVGTALQRADELGRGNAERERSAVKHGERADGRQPRSSQADSAFADIHRIRHYITTARQQGTQGIHFLSVT